MANVIAGLVGHQGPCNCQQESCLERTCPCLVNDRICLSTCNCNNCHNFAGNEAAIFTAQRKFYISANAENPNNSLVVTRRPCTCATSCFYCKCECFQSGLLCIPECNCGNLEACRNNPDGWLDGSIQQQRNAISRRNSHAFDPKYVVVENGKVIYKKGCSCAQIYCASNRCACVWGGIPCHEQCQCDNNCRNPKPR